MGAAMDVSVLIAVLSSNISSDSSSGFCRSSTSWSNSDCGEEMDSGLIICDIEGLVSPFSAEGEEGRGTSAADGRPSMLNDRLKSQKSYRGEGSSWLDITLRI